MAKFTVKYRNKSGDIDFTEVDVANRSAVFPVLKDRGITAIQITEGAMPKKRGSSRSGGASSSHISFGFIVIVILLLAVLGGLAWWFFFSPAPGTRHQAPSTPTPKPIAEVAPSVPAPVAPVVEKVAAQPEKPKTLKERFREKYGNGPMYPARLAMLSHAEKGVEIKSNIGSNAVWETRIARYPDNRIHQELYKYVHPGAFCDTPDPFSDKEALALCSKPMVYDADDPEEIRLEKQAIAAMAQEMKEYIEGGGHARDYLMQAMERQDHESEMMAEVRKNVRELCKSGDADLAKAALDKYNAYLKSKGLPPMKMDAHMKHYLKKNSPNPDNFQLENNEQENTENE